MTWTFHETDPMGGAAGEAYASTLQSSGMKTEHVLAREAIQNSVDALIPGKPKVLVRFRIRSLTGSAKAAFVRAAGLDAIRQRGAALALKGPNCLASLDSAKAPLSLLYIEDHDAVGLNGEPHDRTSHFFRLLLSLGDRAKSRVDDASGGSYGFGKAVYSANSRIQTIFAHSRFRDESGFRTRLFGCGYYATHDFRKKTFSGRAWHGAKPTKDSRGRQVVDPLEGSDADSLADRLGFEARSGEDTGTTLLIIDAAADADDIVRGVEDWWWPRLIEDGLDVEIVKEDGRVVVPKPRKREDLVPFIDCFDIAVQRSIALDGSQRYQPFNQLEDTPMGACGFSLVPLNGDGTTSIPEDRCNTVALIRAPRMVVAYDRAGSAVPAAIGVYVSPPELEGALRLSEPPAHDKWDPESSNLRDSTGQQKRLVEAVLSRARSNLRRFQAAAAPPTSPKPKRLSILERTLGTYFKATGGGVDQPPSTRSPIHIRYSVPPAPIPVDPDKLRLETAFAIELDGDVDTNGADEIELTLKIACSVVEDDGHEGDHLAVVVDSEDVDLEIVLREPPVFRFSIEPGDKARFRVSSAPYDSAWTVRFRPEVARSGEQE